MLSHLNLENNILSNIPFSSLTSLKSLQWLNLAHNIISQPFDVMFTRSLAIDTLILDYNAIESLPAHSFQNFDTVNITSFRGNPLRMIDDDAFKGSKTRELYLHDCDLWNLSSKAFRGLETSLNTLDLSYNNLTMLPENLFDRIDSLKWLSLAHNRLIVDPVKSFNGFTSTLHYLNMLGDTVGVIPMKSLKDMRNVRTFAFSTFPGYYISSEDFYGFGPAVERLYMMNNQITSVHANAFEHVPGLKVLDLSQNDINSFDNRAFANVNGLEELRVNNGLSLTRLPPQPMAFLVNLRKLDLSNNKLTFIQNECLRKMKNLVILNLQDNKIDELSEHQFSSEFTPLLKTIQLSFNEIRKIDRYTFHDIKTLRYIYMDDNKIRRVHKNAFSNLATVEYISLAGNNIRELELEAFQNMPKVRCIDLSYNEMDNLNLDAFEQVGILSALKIDASHNEMFSLEHVTNGSSRWLSYSSIKMIDFGYNNISHVSRTYFESLRSSLLHMWFRHNNMKNISSGIFTQMSQLQFLDFSYNQIKIVASDAFRDTFKLRTIDFSHNELSQIPQNVFNSHRYLKNVDFSWNQMARIPDSIFKDCPIEILKLSGNLFKQLPDGMLYYITHSLRVLDLSHNQLTGLSDAMLGPLENLVSLDLSNNMISKIGYRSFHALFRLSHLDISHNPVKVRYYIT